MAEYRAMEESSEVEPSRAMVGCSREKYSRVEPW